MTQTTDQQLYEQWREDYALTYEPNYDEHLEADCRAAFLAGMEAARRAQVVPQFSPVAQTKLKYLLEAGEAITGYAIENKDGRRGAIDCHGFVYWWHEAAPKQPEAEQCQSCRTGSPYACTCPFKTDRNSDPSCFEAAPVQMPEPWGKEFGDGVWYNLYTEHQVRQLLAQHGIK